MKTYDLAIEELREFQGGHLGYWSKGHHDEIAFLFAVADYLDTQRFVVTADRVRREWWRRVPVPGETCTCTIPAKQGACGAFPVTVVED